MLDKMSNQLNFQGDALLLRAQRQRIIASNIANADTPGYLARDFNFGDALRAVSGMGSSTLPRLALTAPAGARDTVSPADSAARPQTSATAPAIAFGSTHAQHLRRRVSAGRGAQDTPDTLAYAQQTQPNLDNSSVDMDRERATFVDNAVRYEAALRFVNGSAKTMLGAITGQ